MTQSNSPKGVLGSNYSVNRAKRRELYFRFRLRAWAVITAFRQYLPERRDIKLLDLGAADGKTLAFMVRQLPVAEAVGIEYNSELAACMDGSAIDNTITRIEQGDVRNLSRFPDESFDLVSALAILEHIPDPEKAIAEAARVLNPGGLMMASSPIPFWDHLAVKFGLLKEDHHECDMHPKVFHKYFDDEPSLEILEHSRFMFAPVGLAPYLGIQVSPAIALIIDQWIHSIRILDWLFVNQYVVARKLP